MSTKLHSFGYEKLAAIIDVLGDPDTLKILDKATAGFESGKVTIKELKMTTRKYYRSLKGLNDADLVMRFENKYKLTAQGEFIHKLLFNDFSTYLFAEKSMPESFKKIGSRIEVTLIDNYKDLVNVLVATIEKSKSGILLATKYLDMTVAQSIIYAIQREITIKTITSEKMDFSGFIKLIGGFMKSLRPNALKFVVGGESNYRLGDVQLSFMIVDDEIAVFEIPDKEFKFAFATTDKEVVKLLNDLFRETWSKSKTFHI